MIYTFKFTLKYLRSPAFDAGMAFHADFFPPALVPETSQWDDHYTTSPIYFIILLNISYALVNPGISDPLLGKLPPKKKFLHTRTKAETYVKLASYITKPCWVMYDYLINFVPICDKFITRCAKNTLLYMYNVYNQDPTVSTWPSITLQIQAIINA